MKRRFVFRGLVCFLILTGGFGAQGVALREVFKEAKIPTTYQMDASKWICDHQPVANFERFTHPSFQFRRFFHNHTLIYSGFHKVPFWFPRWFSAHQGLRSLVAIKTTDFMKCSGDFFSCAQHGEERLSHAYLRLMYSGELVVEWTTQSHPGLEWSPISEDTELSEPYRVFMYSRCQRVRSAGPPSSGDDLSEPKNSLWGQKRDRSDGTRGPNRG